MFAVVNPSQIAGPSGDANSKSLKTSTPATPVSRYREVKESDCNLTSVNDLRRALVKKRHKGGQILRFSYRIKFSLFYEALSEILEKHIFVGIVDLNRCLSLVQHSTKLYLVNHGALACVPPLLHIKGTLY